MLSEEKLNEYRETIQKILDKYLPEDKRISTKDMSQEWLYFIASYLTEKDKNKRKELRNDLVEKRKEAEKRFKEAEKAFLEEHAEIMTTKEKYDNIFNSANALNDLMNDMNVTKEMEDEINKLG